MLSAPPLTQTNRIRRSLKFDHRKIQLLEKIVMLQEPKREGLSISERGPELRIMILGHVYRSAG